MAWTANTLLISCGISFLLCINILGWLHCLQKTTYYEDGRRLFIFDATYSCLVWLWEIEQKKNTPITLLLVMELDKHLVFCAGGFYFMYDSFFFLVTFLLCRLCLSDIQSAGQMVTELSLPQSSRRMRTSDFEQAYNSTLLNVHIDYL
jgi:hypothetical protein